MGNTSTKRNICTLTDSSVMAQERMRSSHHRLSNMEAAVPAKLSPQPPAQFWFRLIAASIVPTLVPPIVPLTASLGAATSACGVAATAAFCPRLSAASSLSFF